MKLGFIGTGNMGLAILRGYLAAGAGDREEIIAFDTDREKLIALKEQLGIQAADSEAAVVKAADMIVLAVKPNVYEAVLPLLKEAVTGEKVLISIAAGIRLAYIESFFGIPIKVIRAMPNTPALTGKGMSALCRNGQVTEGEFEEAMELFGKLGRVEPVTESLMDAVIGVSGSSPAYAYMFIEALADGAVEQGMPRKQAYTFAAQAVMGAAAMVLETGTHPGELKDMVCSPGGTTISAVAVLEEKGFRDAVMSAVRRAAEKSREMDK